uniref:Uncharacterized protein MANES_16G096500 n=1 Tax=Rhizophora mucronata TaxID=61149 RepID=A0A2P2LK72_RHIMU
MHVNPGSFIIVFSSLYKIFLLFSLLGLNFAKVTIISP